MSYDIASPYIASYVIVRKNGKIAFVFRSNTDWMKNHYGLISGKVEKDETFKQAAIREVKEEIGVIVKPENLKPILVVHRYEPSKHATDWVDIYFDVNKWTGEPFNAEPKVHSELVWLDPDNLPKNIVPSHRFALEQIKAGKTYAEYGWH